MAARDAEKRAKAAIAAADARLGEITTAEFGNKERYEEAKKSSWSSWFS